jgi:hypothetical protein
LWYTINQALLLPEQSIFRSLTTLIHVIERTYYCITRPRIRFLLSFLFPFLALPPLTIIPTPVVSTAFVLVHTAYCFFDDAGLYQRRTRSVSFHLAFLLTFNTSIVRMIDGDDGCGGGSYVLEFQPNLETLPIHQRHPSTLRMATFIGTALDCLETTFYFSKRQALSCGTHG